MIPETPEVLRARLTRAEERIKLFLEALILDQQYVEHCRRCETCRYSEEICFEGDQLARRLAEAKHVAVNFPPAP